MLLILVDLCVRRARGYRGTALGMCPSTEEKATTCQAGCPIWEEKTKLDFSSLHDHCHPCCLSLEELSSSQDLFLPQTESRAGRKI